MATAPARACIAPGCARLNCTIHTARKQYDADRGTAASRGYDARWRRVRAAIIATEPLCRHCATRGIATPATEVDHITPLSAGGERLATWNLQPLCTACHSRKTKGQAANGVPNDNQCTKR